MKLETCPYCQGRGVTAGYDSEGGPYPVECTKCVLGQVQARDEKGRFVK